MKPFLLARITDQDLFAKLMHELGTIIYSTDEKGRIDRVAYFSGSRIVLFEPLNIDENLTQRIKAEGFHVDDLEVDEAFGTIKIHQRTPK